MLTSKQVTPIPTSPLGTPTRAVGTSPMALLLARTSIRAFSIPPVTPSFPEETINGLGNPKPYFNPNTLTYPNLNLNPHPNLWLGGLAPHPVSSKGTLGCLSGLSLTSFLFYHRLFLPKGQLRRSWYVCL